MHLAKAAGSFGERHGPTQTPGSIVLHRNTWSRTQTSGPGAGFGGLPWRIVADLRGGLADFGGGLADLGWRTGGFWRIPVADWRILADWRVLADSLADWRI